MVLSNVVERRRLAKSWHILIGTIVRTPGMIGASDFCNVFVAQCLVRAVHHLAHLARVNEQNLAAAIAELVIASVASQNPYADRYLGCVKKLPRQRNHTIHE